MQTEIQSILKRLLQLHPKSIDLSLTRIKRLLKDLNNPENKIQNAIQVVGTNGKHSVCSTLREIFETAGYSVNMNVSPSLRKFNERYYLSGKYISDDQLYDLLTEVEKVQTSVSILSVKSLHLPSLWACPSLVQPKADILAEFIRPVSIMLSTYSLVNCNKS